MDTDPWINAFNRVKAIDCAKIAARCTDKSSIANAIHQARLTAIEESTANALVH